MEARTTLFLILISSLPGVRPTFPPSHSPPPLSLNSTIIAIKRPATSCRASNFPPFVLVQSRRPPPNPHFFCDSPAPELVLTFPCRSWFLSAYLHFLSDRLRHDKNSFRRVIFSCGSSFFAPNIFGFDLPFQRMNVLLNGSRFRLSCCISSPRFSPADICSLPPNQFV